MKVKALITLPRFHFIPLSLNMTSLGAFIALREGVFSFPIYILTLIGVVLSHMATNILNDYHDYKDGIDISTTRTPFSGGSGVLTAGFLSAKQALFIGLCSLFLAGLIGIYFVIRTGIALLPLILLAGISIYFYNTFFSKRIMGEFIAGFNFGPLLVLGAYFVQTGHYSIEALVASLAPGILTSNLLLVNEFPDAEADKKGGRKHFVISLGKKKAAYLAVFLITLSYLLIVLGVIVNNMPVWTLLALLTVMIGIKTAKGVIRDHEGIKEFIPTMGKNVITVLSTQA
ncbi:MAG: hypothetical protein DRG20_04795, partial [Deltaproteobacteria bacterium]